ncbi:TrbC/VirB2 family protein [Sulfuriferula sp.]|uniref:TrbC/VirB2 family protein n=1 Tax=Sulfuriferula sp. TaxID=2025307 RepID=UPI002731AAB3|nr:TrbC/VirB2 family protein [Sulfuriferula sp.]MDP2027516.1 TrbC/VirB2 family protein [Sulfuriferula sp.]
MATTQYFEVYKKAKRTLAGKAAAIIAVGSVAMLPAIAFAAPWDSVADNVLAIFTGGLTRTIAIIAVIALGIAAMAGKLSWDWVIKIVIGIVFIFGGAAIVDYIIAAAS